LPDGGDRHFPTLNCPSTEHMFGGGYQGYNGRPNRYIDAESGKPRL